MGPCIREAIFKGELHVYPVLIDQQQQRIREPLTFSFLEEIRRSIRENGASSPFSKGLIDSLTNKYITLGTGSVYVT